MTLEQFKASVAAAGIRSLPLFEACRAVLIEGQSQYGVSRAHGIDQGQLSKACRRIQGAPVVAVRKALRAMNDLSSFDDLGCYVWQLGEVDALDMRTALRDLLARLEAEGV